MNFSNLIRQVKSWWLSLDWRQFTYLLFIVLIIVVIFILLLVYFFLSNNELIRGIITNLLSSIVGFLISSLFYSKIVSFESKQRDEQLVIKITSKTQELLQMNDEDEKILSSMKEIGVVQILKEFSLDSLTKKISQAKKRIFILENWICDNLCDPKFEKAFLEAKKKNIEIKILLLDPNSEFALQRSLDLNKRKDRVSDLINTNTDDLKSLNMNLKLNNLELRYHNSIPTLQIFIFDDNAFVGFFLQNTFSHNAPQLDVLINNKQQEPTIFGDIIIKHYEAIWTKARAIQLY